MTVLGLISVIVAVACYFIMLFVLHRFTYRTWVFDAVIVGGVVLAAVGWMRGGTALIAIVTAGFGIAWLVISRLELRLHGSSRLAVRAGTRLPPMHLTTVEGEIVTIEDLARRAPAMLVLYRGWWCPSSKTQLHELLNAYERLAAQGMSIFAASVDTPEQATAMQDYVGDRITILCGLSDDALEAIGARDTRGAPWYDRFLCGAPRQDIAMPTSIVLDRNGCVVDAYRSRRVDDPPLLRTR